ncbi:IS1249 family transposase [Candidatus Berkelbacteria bacterium]|nr:IS1249 family transposase [Candidatus Berkelbacteria bacterium]
MKQRGKRYCSACSTKLQKWGRTAAGSQRWRCPSCTSTNIRSRPDLARAFLLERFVAWLLGKQSQAELSVPDRTWRQQIAWCWNIAPKPSPPNEIHPILLLDGIRIGGFVCLIARTPTAVIAWRWVGWESSWTWSALLEKIPAPTIVVCDGQKGILRAIARCWPQTKIQRCLFHVWQNVRAKLTLHPQTTAGQELLQLTRGLWLVNTTNHAWNWQRSLEAWFVRYGSFIQERTYFEQPISHRRRWWYTHRGIRSAYRQHKELVIADQLFVYLDRTLTDEIIPRTTNHVEGGINSQLRTKLKLHRGLSQLHQQRLVEWYLYSRMASQKPTRNCL